MNNSNIVCPVCTLYLREGVTLQTHLETHPKEQVIEALLKVSSGRKSSQISEATSTVSDSSFTPVQSVTNSNAAFISQATPYMNPQTQMTTAVTYQHIMTSNGAALMPQYVQVPTVINPNNNISTPSNQVNYVPNQTINYSPTMFNPMYNPYIPIPYPFTQPVYTSYPVSSYPAVDTNNQTNQTSSLNEQPVTQQSNIVVEKCSVATNTELEKRNSKDFGSKKSFSKITATTRKVKVFKQKSNESSSSRIIIKTASKSVAGTGVKKTVIQTIRPKEPTSSIDSPDDSPPLTSVSENQKKSVGESKTSMSPSSRKASCYVGDYLKFVKNEGSPECVDLENEICESSDNINNNIFIDQELKPNTVIVDSSTLMPSSNNENRDCSESDEAEVHSIDQLLNNNGESKGTECEERNPLQINDCINEFEEYNEEEEEENEIIEQGGVFQMIEVEEEQKVNVVEVNLSQNQRRESTVEEEENSYDSSDMVVQKEIELQKKSDEPKTNSGAFPEIFEQNIKNSEENNAQDEYSAYNKDLNDSLCVDEPDSIPKSQDLHSVTYTDLQPAKNARVFQDLGLPSSLNFNNFMEVDGIKIIFNNTTSTVSFDPVVKLTTGIQTDGRNFTAYMKNDNQVNNHAIADSVIHLVSGTPESKNDVGYGESYTPTTSQDLQLDLPNLSPLALNIQADESMPARGELSEQESLGAENSSWNLFHGGGANDVKTLEEWRNMSTQSVSLLEVNKPSKSYKCSVCGEVFSCPKERRVHKNTVHLNKLKTDKPAALKKLKSYACCFCKDVFSSARDRKEHIFEKHKIDEKYKKSAQIKQESVESACKSVEEKDACFENETQQQDVKTETSLSSVEGESHRVKYCPKCSLPYIGVKKLREHLRVSHGEIRFKCDTCSACFDEEPEYNEHLLVHPLICDKCGKTFHKKANLNLHLKRHLEVKPYECNLCPKSFITRQKLEEHMNGHSGKKPLKCNLCDKTFSRHSNLIQHRNLHHLNVKKKIKDFVCRCGEVFHSLRKLEWHKEIHEPKPKPCPFCSQKFIHSASVTRHIRRAHLPDYLPGDNREFDNVQCPICEKTYLRSSLTVHMRVHNGEKPFACKICNKQFSTKWNLELHSWTHQSRSNMPFKCQVCKSAFFRETDFVAHINSHRNYKPYTCNICGQKFIRKYSCLRHQEEHKKTKQFVCGVNGCSKSFHRGYYLRDHMKVHTGVRPHTCHICGKASSTKSNHNKHVRIHDTREPVNTEN